MMRISLMVLTALSLAACAAPSAEAEKERFLRADADAVNVEFTDKATAEAIVGFRAVTVATVLKNQQGDASRDTTGESVPARCDIAAKGYKAVFQTPAVVNMPSFGRDTQPVKMTCVYNDKSFSETYKPINLSKSKRTGNAVGVGVILCPVCGVAMAIGNSGEKEGDAFGFDTIQMRVR